MLLNSVLINIKMLIKSLFLIFGLLFSYPVQVLKNIDHIPTMLDKHQEDLFAKLVEQTDKHIQYLSTIGLSERAKGIKINKFIVDISALPSLDLSIFKERTVIAQEIYDFNPVLKNTIITTDQNALENKPEDLQKILDVRLYPVLRNLLKQHRTEIFLGSKQEMVSYYHANDIKILFEFQIPSSAVYYLAESKNEYFVIMAGLVSYENILAQLFTLKLARINLDAITIIGNPNHFKELVMRDIDRLKFEIPQLTKGNNVLIVAGCGLEKIVNELVHNQLSEHVGSSKSFDGNIVSLVYAPLKNPVNGIQGIISLNLNYGEIMEKIIEECLKNFGCKYIFTGGAGGYIPYSDEQRPAIGTYIPITQSVNPSGEVVSLPSKNNANGKDNRLHLQVPSIFVETYDWLNEKKEIGSSVDVETFYIIRAIQNYCNNNPDQVINVQCGYFVSDYVGEQPLREYSKVYLRYAEVLTNFFNKIF